MKLLLNSSLCVILLLLQFIKAHSTNLPPAFTNDINNIIVSENTPVGDVVFTLHGTDPENSTVSYGLTGTDLLKVNSHTGEVIVAKPFNYEANNTLNFFVTIEDEVKDAPVGGNNIVQVPVTVIIVDENDNVPTFQNVPYKVTVDEDTPIGTTIFSEISVTDADTVGDFIEVFCEDLLNGLEGCDTFAVSTIDSLPSSYHGALVLMKRLDFATKTEYELILRAVDGNLNSTTNVNIKVGDVQNTPPIFIGPLNAEVSEDAPINTLVLTVHAEDGDRGMPRRVLYELINNPLSYFIIDPVSGEIRTARPLDKEAIDNLMGLIILNVKATEVVNGGKSNDPLTTTQAEVTIVIKDVNDEPPAFNKNEYYVEISEDIPNGFALPNLNMTVTDPDVGNNSIFALSLDDFSHSFVVEPEVVVGSSPVTIKILNGSLDYEDPNHRKFIMLIIAKELYTSPQLSSTATITVTVTDANDNSPSFDLKSYSAVVSEMAPPGTLVTTIVAKDRDSGRFGENGIVYELLGEGAEKFVVNNRTGTVTVNDCNSLNLEGCLDFETMPEYSLLFKATDDDGKGLSTTVPLRIMLSDSNDNPPIFDREFYNVSINEGAVKFDPDLIIEAKDRDKTSHVTYSIIAGNINDMFTIDSNTGKMRIGTNKMISFNEDPNKNIITLNIEATDGKYTAVTIVNVTIVDINDHPPQFDKDNYLVSIPEDVKIGTSIYELRATDEDTGVNAELSYYFKKGTFDDFEIEEATGVIIVASKLDFDKRSNYNIEVAATDHGPVNLTGTTVLNIKIINTNDKPPYFVPTIQKTEVMKDAKIGTVIYTLKAHDPDVNTTEALSFEAVEPITALDKYGQSVNNSLFKEFFSIHKNTGNVLVNAVLQRDIAAIVKITVLVTDITASDVQEGEGLLIINIIDINDQPPTFLPPWTPEKPQYDLIIDEELPVGTIVSTFEAVDDDSNIAGYYIEPPSKYFEINAGTGILQIKQRIDYEEIRSLNFTIVAYDSGTPQLNSTAMVLVTVSNINDNAPNFTQKMYNATVEENSPNGTHVITVIASDLDMDEYGEVTYNLVGEHSENFRITSKSGQIYVNNPSFLDHEILNETTIQVVANDGAPGNLKHSISVPIHITIVDVNDNEPKFNQSNYNATISENVRVNPPYLILQVFAEDEDEGLNGQISYKITSGNEEDIFLLGEDTGILYAHRPLLGKTGAYTLEIEAIDEGGKGPFNTKTVANINVINVNENKPVFIIPSTRNSTIEVTEKAEANALLMVIKAVDKDTGENGRITYHLKKNQINVQETEEFTLNPNSGELRTKIFLDRAIRAKYELNLVARDHGVPLWHETTHPLTVLFVNSNEFETDAFNSYHFYIDENTKANTLIGRIQTGFFDDKLSQMYYYLISGSLDVPFSIHKLDGSIYTKKPLDREETEEYDLIILANNEPDFYLTSEEQNRILRNESTYLNNLFKVKITVNDLNDNAPRFKRSEYFAGVNSISDVNTFIMNLTATDPDLGINGSHVIYVKNSNLYKYGSNQSSGAVIPSPFNISDDGALYTALSLSENNQHHFIVDVVAREIVPSGHEGSTKVYIWIYEPEQLIRIILSRPVDEVIKDQNEIISELSNATNFLIVNNGIKPHITDTGEEDKEWSDMYILAVNPSTQTIASVYDILKIIDAKYDFLKDYYAGFAIKNVVPAYVMEEEESFDPALSALIALLLVLLVGIVTFTVVCCCLRNWMISPNDLKKKKDILISKAIIDELNTTENPLWIEQKLKIYEEQELTMQVFNEPDQNALERRSSAEFSPEDNTYATIQAPNRRGSAHTATLSLADDIADYATLSRLPHNISSSRSSLKDTVNYYEAAMGFQGSTFQVPESSTDLDSGDEYRSQMTINQNGQPEFVAELI